MPLSDYYSHSATVLPVHDITASRSFYVDLLDFHVTFEWGDPVDYLVMTAHEQIALHLSQRPAEKVLEKVTIYIFVEEIDALYNALYQRGANIHTEIGDRDYHMRDFDLLDPDGHMITFGCGTSQQ